MPRYKLIEAREKAELSPSELARRIRCERKAVNRWERGEAEPRMEYRSAIRRELNNNDDADLFKNYPEGQYPDSVSPSVDNCQQVTTKEQMSPTCQADTPHDKMDSSDAIDIRESEEEPLSMDKLRRKIAKVVGTTLVGANLQTLTSPFILSEGHTGPTAPPEESIPQCAFIIESCWEYFNQGNYTKVERGVQKTLPTLRRLANTKGPYQGIAANLAVQANIMQIPLANRNLNFMEREVLCIEAVHFGGLSGNRDLQAIAQFWQGDTFTYCYDQPLQAIDILNNALKDLGSGPSLVRSAIYSDLSIAHAQDKDERSAKENEELSRDYMEMARNAWPDNPELDPFFRCIGHNLAELDQFDGKALLHLAERTHNRKYAELARDAFDKSTNTTGKGFLVQAYIRRADAARVLGDMNGCVTCLANVVEIAVGLSRFIEAGDVISNMPDKWKRETAVQKLQKKITHAIVVRR